MNKVETYFWDKNDSSALFLEMEAFAKREHNINVNHAKGLVRYCRFEFSEHIKAEKNMYRKHGRFSANMGKWYNQARAY